MEGQIAFETLLARFPELALAPGEAVSWRPNLGLRGLAELHVLAS
jgi:cytochrome P450